MIPVAFQWKGSILAARRSRAAFTILEIMIAISIFAMVLTAIYTIWISILKGSKTAMAAAAGVQRSRIAIRSIEDALLTTTMYSANINEYSFVGEANSVSMLARLPATFPGVGRYGDQVVRRVSFYTQAGKDGMDELIMSQHPMLLDTTGTVEAYTITLARDVSEFSLGYYDAQKKKWSEDWIITTNQLPKMVRVILGLGKLPGSNSKAQDVVAKIVALPATAVGPDLQGAVPATGGLNTNRLGQDPRMGGDRLRQGGGTQPGGNQFKTPKNPF